MWSKNQISVNFDDLYIYNGKNKIFDHEIANERLMILIRISNQISLLIFDLDSINFSLMIVLYDSNWSIGR